MAVIEKRSDFLIRNATPLMQVAFSAVAGETIEAGDLVAYDIGEASRYVFQAQSGDADLANVIGIALSNATVDNPVKIALPGSHVAGFDIDPSSEATQAPGTTVWSGADGTLHDEPEGANSVNIGTIITIGSSGGDYVILVRDPVAAPEVGGGD